MDQYGREAGPASVPSVPAILLMDARRRNLSGSGCQMVPSARVKVGTEARKRRVRARKFFTLFLPEGRGPGLGCKVAH